MRHTFTTYAKVRGQGRPRVDYARRRTYKPAVDRSYEQRIKEDYINSGGPHFGSGPLRMTIHVYRSLPRSAPKRIDWEHDTKKPDATNIAKAVEDALNRIAYNDDAQIVISTTVKHERERRDEHFTVTIETIGGRRDYEAV